nr:reverse transcriptase domain-containing protein [Tanacetum cinerariifolium]
MPERLAGNEFYCFPDGFSRYFQIPIDLQDQEKTTFTCPYGTFGYRRMPFGLCNAPSTFQRCMMSIFHDMIEKMMEVFMDDFSVFGDSFSSCLTNWDKMLNHCEETNLVLNWEKCHFMCREGIVLGHKISKSGIEVDRAKVDVIAKLPHPTTVKGVRSFLGHAGFYRCFIQDFSKIARPMTHILEKETPFVFSKESLDILKAFHEGPSGGHHGANLIAKKVFDAGFFWPSIYRDAHETIKTCDIFQREGKIYQKDEMPPNTVDYLSKWVEAKALPTNDAIVVVKFLKSLFSRFGIPRAIISDRGTHFCNDQFTRVMIKYGVTHRLATAYHPQTSSQVKVSNRGLKRILKRTMGGNRTSWSDKLDDALWAFHTAYKTPIGCTPYKLVYGKSCHLLIELEHRAYWALKHVNGHCVKHYFGGNIPSNVAPDLHTFPWTTEFGDRVKLNDSVIKSKALRGRHLISVKENQEKDKIGSKPDKNRKRAARRWFKKEPPYSITTWDDLAWERYKDLLLVCPHDGFTELHQLDTFYNDLNPADQDSLNAAAGGNLLEKRPQDALTIIENKSKVCNSRSKPIASPVNACDINSSSEIAKLTHAVNQQTSAVTTAMTAMLKQLQENPPQAQVKAVEEICITCGGAHPYYQCLAAGGNTFPEFRDNIQAYVLASAGNYNQGNPSYRPQGVANQMRPPVSGSLPGNTVANPKVELKAITTRSGLVTDGPTVPTPPKSVTPEEDECVEETYTDPDLAEYTIKVPPPPAQKPKPPELANTLFNENCSAVILKKLPEELGDPGKFLISCGFSELKCKALADLGASINLMPLSVWKKLGLPDLIPTRMTLELANHVICTPDGIARDVFVPVGKFTFLADFVVVDYESDPRVPLILGRPFLRTAHALIDVHDEEMILCDGDERLTLNMKHDTASYSKHPHRESANLINIFNIPSEDCLEVSVSNKQSGNPTFSLHKEIASLEVTHEIHDSEGCNFLSEELPNIDSFNDIHPHFDDNPLSGSTTYSSNSLLEEFTDELALITYPSDYDDNITCDIESDLREIEFLLYQGKYSNLKDLIDQTYLANLANYFVDPTPEMFTDEHAPDYSFSSRFDVYPNDFLEIESDADNFYDDPFDSKGEKIKEDDDLPSPENEDKVFNPGILIHEKLVTIITRVAQEKKLAISYASLVFEDFDTPFYEPLVFKDIPNSMRLLPFSSENEETVFKPGIYTSEKVHSCFIPELSHLGYPIFKVNQIFISLMKIFHVQSGKNTPLLDVLLFHFYPP